MQTSADYILEAVLRDVVWGMTEKHPEQGVPGFPARAVDLCWWHL